MMNAPRRSANSPPGLAGTPNSTRSPAVTDATPSPSPDRRTVRSLEETLDALHEWFREDLDEAPDNLTHQRLELLRQLATWYRDCARRFLSPNGRAFS
jgi:hypothetical protein